MKKPNVLLILLFIFLYCFSPSKGQDFRKNVAPTSKKQVSEANIKQKKDNTRSTMLKNVSEAPLLTLKSPNSYPEHPPVAIPVGPVVAEGQLMRATKLPQFTASLQKSKNVEELITEIEKEIEKISKSNEAEKDLRLKKLEKLLQKKKLEKFSVDKTKY